MRLLLAIVLLGVSTATAAAQQLELTFTGSVTEYMGGNWTSYLVIAHMSALWRYFLGAPTIICSNDVLMRVHASAHRKEGSP